MNKQTKANLYLLLGTAAWGLTFPLVKLALVDVDATTFVACRFMLATLFFFFIVKKQLKYTNRRVILQGLTLGALNCGVYILQTMGLATISSADSAFITAFNVVLIPLLAPLFKLGHPSPLDFIFSFLCLLGVFVLTGASFTRLSIGDFWTILCAIFSALSILYLQFITRKTRVYNMLVFYQIAFTVPLPLLISLHNPSYNHILMTPVIIGLLYTSIIATCVVFLWQVKYQGKTTAMQAALIYALEPVFATVYAFCFFGESITEHVIIGGGIILATVIASEISRILIVKRRLYKQQRTV